MVGDYWNDLSGCEPMLGQVSLCVLDGLENFFFDEVSGLVFFFLLLDWIFFDVLF